VPTLLSTSVVTLFILLFLDAPRGRHGAYRPPEAGVLVRLCATSLARPRLMFVIGNIILQYRHDVDFSPNGGFDIQVS
jgi:hypothetical protein